MLVIDGIAGMAGHAGATAGPGPWLAVDQAMIDAFANATGDRQWIHIDTHRARREMPGGKTIAHGFLLLSLIPQLLPAILEVRQTARAINCGLDRLRFVTPVPVDSRVRLRTAIVSAESAAGGCKATFNHTLELEGSERPALVAAMIVLFAG